MFSVSISVQPKLPPFRSRDRKSYYESEVSRKRAVMLANIGSLDNRVVVPINARASTEYKRFSRSD